ncbi:MAG: hypothetical protein HYY93_12375 [Planctomycetes bacterium]|nr:hypothetical protein [Planctomycetota bacterium]
MRVANARGVKRASATFIFVSVSLGFTPLTLAQVKGTQIPIVPGTREAFEVRLSRPDGTSIYRIGITKVKRTEGGDVVMVFQNNAEVTLNKVERQNETVLHACVIDGIEIPEATHRLEFFNQQTPHTHPALAAGFDGGGPNTPFWSNLMVAVYSTRAKVPIYSHIIREWSLTVESGETSTTWVPKAAKPGLSPLPRYDGDSVYLSQAQLLSEGDTVPRGAVFWDLPAISNPAPGHGALGVGATLKIGDLIKKRTKFTLLAYADCNDDLNAEFLSHRVDREAKIDVRIGSTPTESTGVVDPATAPTISPSPSSEIANQADQNDPGPLKGFTPKPGSTQKQ